MNRWHVFLIGWAAFLMAAFVALSGIVPIQASSGHWRVTAFMLDLFKRRSVSTYAMSIEAPALDRSELVARGAAIYERNCRICHGSPAADRGSTEMAMTPPPPLLPPRMARWNDAELFQIVKHGIKFTGMPAWSAPTRNDEVWALVAFLRRLDRLPADEYRRLAVGGADRPASPTLPALMVCAACHGIDGRGRDGAAFPIIASQSAQYLRNALDAYARGWRHSGVMRPVAGALDLDARDAVARYYSALPPGPPLRIDGDSARGEAIALRGIPQQRVPACIECHRPATAERHPAYPILHAQHPEYLLSQLQLFVDDARGGAASASIMRPIAQRLTAQQRQDVATYFGGSSR